MLPQQVCQHRLIRYQYHQEGVSEPHPLLPAANVTHCSDGKSQGTERGLTLPSTPEGLLSTYSSWKTMAKAG